MIPAKGYIVREVQFHHDVTGNATPYIHSPAGHTSLFHITESPDPLPIDTTPLEQLTLALLNSIDTKYPPTVDESEADWFFDFDDQVTLNDGTQYRRISDKYDASRTHMVTVRKAVYKRKEEEKK